MNERNIVRKIPKASVLIWPRACMMLSPPFFSDFAVSRKVDLKRFVFVSLVNSTRKTMAST